MQKLYTVVCSRSFSASIFYSRIHAHWRLFWSFFSSQRVSARGWPFRAGFWLVINFHGNPTLKASIFYRFHGREYFQLCYIERTIKTRDYGHLFEIRAALLLLPKPANIVQSVLPDSSRGARKGYRTLWFQASVTWKGKWESVIAVC